MLMFFKHCNSSHQGKKHDIEFNEINCNIHEALIIHLNLIETRQTV